MYTPALDWILKCLFYKQNDASFEGVLNYFSNLSIAGSQSGCSALVLNSLISCYPSSFIARHLIQFIELIRKVNKDVMIDDGKSTICTSVYPKYILIKNIGESLNQEEDLFSNYSIDRTVLFEEFWKIAGKLKSKYEYVSCLEVWSEVVAKYNDIHEINDLLGEIIANMLSGREFESYSSNLLVILSKIVQFGSVRFHYSAFFLMSNLLPYLDLFHKDEFKIEACKSIVTSFVKSFSECDSNETTSDPVILNSITYLCKLMHDSINALTLEDEKRQISILIIGFIRRISFGRDFEAQLNFYVESRANFSNLDLVMGFIVQQVNTLAMETHRTVNGNHTKKTISFVSACIAFSYITVPSIEDIIIKLQLYISSSHVALINTCLPQTDAFLKSAITLLRQLPSFLEGPDGKLYSNDEFLHSYVSQLLSILIVVPVRRHFFECFTFQPMIVSG